MLHVLRQTPGVQVAGLLTTINETHRRVAMHAVREELLEAQALAAGLPLWKVNIPHPCSNERYEEEMRGAVDRARAQGIQAVAFGDLFLEDIRAYRVRMMAGTELEPLFPIWGIPTDRLARDMVRAGLKARVTCVDPRVLDRSFCGREFDDAFLDSLPPSVDPCGERGEFHTFASAGPMFERPIAIRPGEVVERDGFVFADLLPARAELSSPQCAE